MSNWHFDWPLPVWQLVVLVLLAIGIVLASYLRQSSYLFGQATTTLWLDRRVWTLLVLRIVALGLLFWMLLGLTHIRLEPTAASVWIAIDESASMLQEDLKGTSSASNTRRSKAIETIERIRSSLAKEQIPSKVEYFSMGEALRVSDWDSIIAKKLTDMDKSSELNDSLLTLIERARIEQPRAIYLFTDGLDTRLGTLQPNNSNRLAADMTQIVAFVSKRDLSRAAVTIERVENPNLIFQGDEVQSSVRFHADGLMRKSVKFQLIDQETQQQVATQTMDVNASPFNGVTDLKFVPTNAGAKAYSLQVSYFADNDEVQKLEKSFTLMVRRDPLKVLVIANNYSYEVRFLKHYLERTRQSSDPQRAVFDPIFCISGAERSLVQADPSMISYLPVDSTWWQQFEACIMIDVGSKILDEVVSNALRSSIEDQGLGAIIVNGPENMMELWDNESFRTILPIRKLQRISSSSESVRFLPDAESFGIYIDAAVPPDSSLAFQKLNTTEIGFTPKVSASVLASQGEQPFLITQLIGSGQVILQTTDETYRWRNMSGSDATYHRYWASLIGLVSTGNRRQTSMVPMRVQSTQESWSEGELVELRFDATGTGLDVDNIKAIPIKLSLEGRNEIKAELTRIGTSSLYRVQIQIDTAGVYSVFHDHENSNSTSLPISGTIRVQARRTETSSEEPDTDSLRQFVQSYGGRLEEYDAWKASIDRLPNEKTLHFEPLPPQSIWNYPLVVGIVIIALGTEWYLRNRWGLI